MKKALSLILALVMALSLAACGSKAEETKPAESVKTTEAAKTETVKEEKRTRHFGVSFAGALPKKPLPMLSRPCWTVSWKSIPGSPWKLPRATMTP